MLAQVASPPGALNVVGVTAGWYEISLTIRLRDRLRDEDDGHRTVRT